MGRHLKAVCSVELLFEGIFKNDKYITIVGMNHYYELTSFKVGKKLSVLRRRITHTTAMRKAVIKNIGIVYW